MLTESQKNIIQLMTEEFSKLNSTEVESQGLIDIAGIIEQSSLETQFIKECIAITKAFEKLKIDTMLRDMESIRGDLKKLNLGIKRTYENSDSIVIYPTHKPYHELVPSDKLRLEYITSYYTNRSLGNVSRSIPSKYIVRFLENSTFYVHRNTLAGLIATEKFKEQLKYLYKQTQE
jgi:hypothetical protein